MYDDDRGDVDDDRGDVDDDDDGDADDDDEKGNYSIAPHIPPGTN